MRALAIIFLMSALSLAGCSNHWRDADAGLSDQDLLLMLAEAQDVAAASSDSTGVADIVAMKDQSGVSIFFADNAGPLGGVANVLSLVDFSFLGDEGSDSLSVFSIENVRVFFLSVPVAGGGFDTGLILGIQRSGEKDYRYYGFRGVGEIVDDQYVTELAKSDALTLILRSDDVEEGDLTSVIQFHVYNAQDEELGKIPTMVGFGG